MLAVHKAELVGPSDRIWRLGERHREFTSVSNSGKNTTRTKHLIQMVKNFKATSKKLHLGFENW